MEAICMVEGQANEVPEDIMVGSLEFGHEHIKTSSVPSRNSAAAAASRRWFTSSPCATPISLPTSAPSPSSAFRPPCTSTTRPQRYDTIDAVKAETLTHLKEKYGDELFDARKGEIKDIYGDLKKHLLRDQVIKTNTRIDGRGLCDVRPITIELGVLPRAHGSCLFTRGETQAIVTTTLGTSRDEMRIDELTGDEFRRFYLHYNFPSWSVGEVRRMSGPGRREIGHGKLAERSLTAVLPFGAGEAGEERAPFPYTIRIVSEITESNGSSSMATVCGGSLSMMDAGVPICAPRRGHRHGPHQGRRRAPRSHRYPR
jgi:polyribonucleotide nucleotidyltransferase